MSKNRNNRPPTKKQLAERKLAEEVHQVDAMTLPASLEDYEMISLIVEETIKGVDISKRYPTFYQKLLSDSSLRQAFLETLESIEPENKDQPVPLPRIAQAYPAFFSQRPSDPKLEKIGKDNWRVSWQQSIEQLKTIFSPPALAPRSDLSLFEDQWFMLLRGETKIGTSIYTFDLEGTFPEGETEVLSTFLDLAVTLEVAGGPRHFPIQATLQWGSYQASLLLSQEGRIRFPNIPFTSVFDAELKHIKSDLSFSLETVE